MKGYRRLAASAAVMLAAAASWPSFAPAAGYTNGYNLYGPKVVYPVTRRRNKPYWGLETLKSRTGRPDWKLVTGADGLLAPMRTIFRDAVYGTEIWRLAHHMEFARHFYGDCSPWNLNGSMMVFRSSGGRLLLDGTGARARKLVLPPDTSLSKMPLWDRGDPDVLYCASNWISGKAAAEQPRGIYRVNLRTGKSRKLYDLARVAFESPLSVDGEWMAFKARRETRRLAGAGRSGAAIARVDGSKLIWLKMSTPHTVRVVGGKRFLFEMEGRFIDRRGRVFGTHASGKNTGGSHRTYNWLGTRMASHSKWGFQIVDIRGTRFVNHRVLYTEGWSGGHTSWLCDDQEWVFASTAGGQALGGQLLKIRTDGSGTVHRIAHHNSSGRPYSAEVHAACSPDGTKYMFASDALAATPGKGKRIGSFVAVVKRPDPPQQVSLRDTTAGKVHINWGPPFHDREVSGYHVYRSGQSGMGFEQITDAPVAAPEYTDRTLEAGESAYYVVTSVEQSGLESSRFSNEVGVVAGQKGFPPGHVRHFAEAEGPIVRVDPPMREERDVTAAGDECLWHGPGEGKAEFYADYFSPRPGEYHCWIRVKSPAPGRLDIVRALNGVTVPEGPRKRAAGAILRDLNGFDVPDTKGRWVWVKTRRPGPLKILPARYRKRIFLVIQSRCPGVKIDRLAWSTDGRWTPSGRGAFDQTPPAAPTGLRAVSLGNRHVKVTWKKNSEKDLRYYNVYASIDAPAAVEQRHLLLSPARSLVVDWGIPPAAGAVHYAVTAVDRAGNESPPARVKLGL